MKKIILLCASGMSTSMLVKKMQEAAEAEASREAEEQAAQEQKNSGTDPSDEDGDHDNG